MKSTRKLHTPLLAALWLCVFLITLLPAGSALSTGSSEDRHRVQLDFYKLRLRANDTDTCMYLLLVKNWSSDSSYALVCDGHRLYGLPKNEDPVTWFEKATAKDDTVYYFQKWGRFIPAKCDSCVNCYLTFALGSEACTRDDSSKVALLTGALIAFSQADKDSVYLNTDERETIKAEYHEYLPIALMSLIGGDLKARLSKHEEQLTDLKAQMEVGETLWRSHWPVIVGLGLIVLPFLFVIARAIIWKPRSSAVTFPAEDNRSLSRATDAVERLSTLSTLYYGLVRMLVVDRLRDKSEVISPPGMPKDDKAVKQFYDKLPWKRKFDNAVARFNKLEPPPLEPLHFRAHAQVEPVKPSARVYTVGEKNEGDGKRTHDSTVPPKELLKHRMRWLQYICNDDLETAKYAAKVHELMLDELRANSFREYAHDLVVQDEVLRRKWNVISSEVDFRLKESEQQSGDLRLERMWEELPEDARHGLPSPEWLNANLQRLRWIVNHFQEVIDRDRGWERMLDLHWSPRHVSRESARELGSIADDVWKAMLSFNRRYDVVGNCEQMSRFLSFMWEVARQGDGRLGRDADQERIDECLPNLLNCENLSATFDGMSRDLRTVYLRVGALKGNGASPERVFQSLQDGVAHVIVDYNRQFVTPVLRSGHLLKLLYLMVRERHPQQQHRLALLLPVIEAAKKARESLLRLLEAANLQPEQIGFLKPRELHYNVETALNSGRSTRCVKLRTALGLNAYLSACEALGLRDDSPEAVVDVVEWGLLRDGKPFRSSSTVVNIFYYEYVPLKRKRDEKVGSPSSEDSAKVVEEKSASPEMEAKSEEGREQTPEAGFEPQPEKEHPGAPNDERVEDTTDSFPESRGCRRSDGDHIDPAG